MQVLQVVDHCGVARYTVLYEQVGLELLAWHDDRPLTVPHDVHEFWVLGGGVGKGYATNVAEKQVHFVVWQNLDENVGGLDVGEQEVVGS